MKLFQWQCPLAKKKARGVRRSSIQALSLCVVLSRVGVVCGVVSCVVSC